MSFGDAACIYNYSEKMAEKVVIIDNGSHSIKAGFAGDDMPKCFVSSLLGEKKEGSDDQLVGDAVRDMEVEMDVRVKSVRSPIDRGVICDWPGMVKLWTEVFQELGVDASKCKVLVTDSPTNSQDNRNHMVSTLFENFGPVGVFVASQASLVPYAAGRMTALIVDCGDSAIHIVPVYEGYTMKEQIQKFPLGGTDVAKFSEQSLRNCNPENTKWSVFDPQAILIKYGKVAEDYDQEVQSSTGHEHTLPCGSKVKVDSLATYSPEMLFNPKIADPESEVKGIHHLIDGCIKSCDIDCRQDLLSNIILAGGTSLIPGFPERLSKELGDLLGPKFKVVVRPERNVYPWIGGSVMATLPEFSSKWITKEEFENEGTDVVAKRCP